jgi:hypothetical protein
LEIHSRPAVGSGKEIDFQGASAEDGGAVDVGFVRRLPKADAQSRGVPLASMGKERGEKRPAVGRAVSTGCESLVKPKHRTET